MANYYRIVDLDSKEVYGLGTTTSVLTKLPLMAKKLSGKHLCFYGDESYPWGEDKYETFFDNKDFGTPWGAKFFDKGEPCLDDCKDCIFLTREQFEVVVAKLEGKELPNLYEEIYKTILKGEVI